MSCGEKNYIRFSPMDYRILVRGEQILDFPKKRPRLFKETVI